MPRSVHADLNKNQRKEIRTFESRVLDDIEVDPPLCMKYPGRRNRNKPGFGLQKKCLILMSFSLFRWL